MLTRSCAPLFAALVLSVPGSGSAQPTSGTAPLLLDGNRIYAELEFVRPDGSRRNTLAFVDLGGPSVIVSPELYRQLRLSSQAPTTFQIGGLPVRLDAGKVSADSWLPYFIAHRRRVEALLPAAVLQRYQVVIDYGQRTMTLAQPDTLKFLGTPVPVSVNSVTGLAAVNITIDGHSYAATLDGGSAYWDFMDWYSKKNQVPVIGWLGGNVLQGFRIAIDYPRRMSYWQPQRRLNSHDLDQVALTLARKHGEYFVTAIATRDGKAAVEGIQVGDKLLQIGSLSTHAASSSAVLEALSGKPGELRRLVVERDGKSLVVRASVTEF